MLYLGFPLNDNPKRFDKKELKKGKLTIFKITYSMIYHIMIL